MNPQTDKASKYARQSKIAALISAQEIATQEDLTIALAAAGFDVTQATVSRDIKELKLFKMSTPSGAYRYAMPGAVNITDTAYSDAQQRFAKIFKDVAISVNFSGNMLVIKTLPACADAACEAIDSLGFPHILGSIAGDNTVFLVADTPENAPIIAKRFTELLK